ncbi:MAG TPA: sigma-70 family RNA polymerase sigma factor [Streptosporangiaceae bacterium]
MDAELTSLAGGRELRPGPAAGDSGRGAMPAPAGREDGAAGMTALFRAHHLELVRLALMMTGDLAAAEDVVQDVFERMHRRPPLLRSDTAGLAYARAAVLNGCRSDHGRNAVRRKHAATMPALAESGPDAHAAIADRGVLAAALHRLPGRQREVLVLRYYCDLDVGEIAAMLRIGPSAVRSAMSRGLAALAGLVGEDAR